MTRSPIPIPVDADRCDRVETKIKIKRVVLRGLLPQKLGFVVMFSSDTKVKIAKPLYQRLSDIAQAGGYSSTEEFIVHILEKEAAKFADAADEEEVKKQLRGLGYIE